MPFTTSAGHNFQLQLTINIVEQCGPTYFLLPTGPDQHQLPLSPPPTPTLPLRPVSPAESVIYSGDVPQLEQLRLVQHVTMASRKYFKEDLKPKRRAPQPGTPVSQAGQAALRELRPAPPKTPAKEAPRPPPRRPTIADAMWNGKDPCGGSTAPMIPAAPVRQPTPEMEVPDAFLYLLEAPRQVTTTAPEVERLLEEFDLEMFPAPETPNEPLDRKDFFAQLRAVAGIPPRSQHDDKKKKTPKPKYEDIGQSKRRRALHQPDDTIPKLA